MRTFPQKLIPAAGHIRTCFCGMSAGGKSPFAAQIYKIFLDTPSESCYNKKYHYTRGKELI